LRSHAEGFVGVGTVVDMEECSPFATGWVALPTRTPWSVTWSPTA